MTRTRRAERALVGCAIASSVVAGCGAVVQLTAPGPGCKKAPLQAAVRFDATHMWLENPDTGATMKLAPRSDAHWVFEPGESGQPFDPPELVDRAAKSVIHDGDIINAACHDDVSDTYFIGPDDVPNDHNGGADVLTAPGSRV